MNRGALLVLLGAMLAGCALQAHAPSDSLRTETVRKEALSSGALPSMEAKRGAIQAYRDFLNSPATGEARAEALMRLADLLADVEEASSTRRGARPDYAPSMALYRERLDRYPDRSDNDRVLYQIARLSALMTKKSDARDALAALISKYAKSPYVPEASFRLGEIEFGDGRMDDAARAFSRILDDKVFGERARYHLAWCRYRLGDYTAALRLFVSSTDRKLSGASGDPADIARLPDADKELVADILRGIALSLDRLGGPEAIQTALDAVGRRPYEAVFYRALGDHYAAKTRIQDAARSYDAYVRDHPDAPDAVAFADLAIGAYLRGNFPREALAAKADMVRRFGPGSPWYATASGKTRLAWDPILRRAAREMARSSHATAQKSGSSDDYGRAVDWYRYTLAYYPSPQDAAALRFELAEALYKSGRFEEAALDYEESAYGTPRHAASAEAGYALIVCRERIIQAETSPERRAASTMRWIVDAERFVRSFPADPRVAAVALKAAQRLFDREEYDRAKTMATAVSPERLDPALAFAAADLAARADDARGRDVPAEEEYRRALALADAGNPTLQSEIRERLASVIYRQGDAQRRTGDSRSAASSFARVEKEAPGTQVAPVALYEAGTTLVSLRDASAAAPLFLQIKERYPKASVYPQAVLQLGLAYEAMGRGRDAAAEYEAAATALGSTAEGAKALLAAGRLYESLQLWPDASRIYGSVGDRDVLSTIERMETRYKAGALEDRLGRSAEARKRYAQVVHEASDIPTGQDAVARTLKARAAYRLAEFTLEEFSKIRLTSPLEKALKKKRQALRDVLQDFALAASFHVQEITLSSTCRIGETLESFKTALLESERPSRLTPSQREQYDFLLEEQAIPYEEQAIEAYENNLKRMWTNGVYDNWIGKSLARLAALRPERYKRPEAAEIAANPAETAEAHYNMGLARRREGKFIEAEREYRTSLDQNPSLGATAYNLAILYEIYMGRPDDALTYYKTYVKLGGERREEVQRWIDAIEKRGKGVPNEKPAAANRVP